MNRSSTCERASSTRINRRICFDGECRLFLVNSHQGDSMQVSKILVVAPLVLFACGGAHAADYPVKAQPQALDWTGLYLGIHAGYANGHLTADTGQTRSFNGGSGGGQVGYNYQVSSRWVLGAEIDADLAAIKGTFIQPDPLVPNVILADEAKIDYGGTPRARAGGPFHPLLGFRTRGLF